MRRFALAIVIGLFMVTLAASGQSCPPPVIALAAGSNPTCAGQPVTLDVSGAWVSYQWSTGATTRMITDSPSSTTSYSVTTTDANGCNVTSQPFVVTVNGVAPAPPAIHVSLPEMCANGFNSVSIDAPSQGNWLTVNWTIEHGTITPNTWMGTPALSAQVSGDGSGIPAVVHVAVTDSYGCGAENSATIPMRTIAAPAIHVSLPEMCANGFNSVSIDPPSEGNWMTVNWSIEHGTITPNSWMGTPATSAQVLGDGSGNPPVVHVSVTDSYACTAQSSVSIPIRTIAAPAIHVSMPEMCANGFNSVSIDPPSEGNWTTVDWTIEHGTITPNSWFGSPATSAQVLGDGSGIPPVVHVSVIDSYTCTAQSSVTIPIRTIAPPAFHTSAPDMCPNGFNSISIDPPAEGNWTTVTWSIEHGTITPNSWFGSPATSAQVLGDGSGIPPVVHVSVTDSYTCTAENSVTIPIRVLTPPPITLAYPSVCAGGLFHASIPQPDQWSNWQSVQWTATNARLTASAMSSNDTYGTATGGPVTLTVTVTDYSGCSTSSSVTIPVATNPPTAVMTVSPAVCANGQFTVTAEDPNDPTVLFTFWATNAALGSNNGRSADFTAGPAGAIEVYATRMGEDQTCATYGHVSTMAVNAPPTPAITASGPTTFCAGGSVTLTAPAGYSYSWSNGAHTQSITVNDAGSYDVTVSTAPSCSATSAPVTVSINANPAKPDINVQVLNRYASLAPMDFDAVRAIAANSGGTYTYCLGNNIRIWTTATGVSYHWSNGATTASIETTTAGTYSVTITDANGCTSTSDPVTIVFSDPPPATITASGPTTICPNGSVTLTASAGDSYLWSNGATTQSITVSTADFYSVAVTTNSCTRFASTQVSNPSAYIYATSTQLCGSQPITISANSGASSYLWSNGATTQNISVTQPGTYSVTETYNGSCQVTSQSVTIQAGVTATIVATPPRVCGTQQITLNASAIGGTAPYHYQWTREGYQIGNDSATLIDTISYYQYTPDMHYALTVTDANSCTFSTSTTITSGAAVVVGLQAIPTVCANGAGSAMANSAGGRTYQWSITNGTIVNTYGASMNYTAGASGDVVITLTATDPGGCSSTESKTVTIVQPPAAPTITASGPTTFCPNGRVTLSAPAGYWMYAWTRNGTPAGGGQTLDAYQAGDYRVSVWDANGCTSAESAPVTVTIHSNPPTPAITASGPTTFCEGENVTLTAPAGYTYHWSTNETTQSIVVSTNATITVTVIDANGCSSTSNATYVTMKALPQTTVTASGATTFCQGGNVMLSAPQVTGYTYLWSTGATTRTITVNATGNYNVVVTAPWGCSATSANTSVTVNPPPDTTITPSGATTFCQGGSVTLSAPAVTGYTYHWSSGETTRSITVTSTGNYSVTITDANGCSKTSDATPVTVNWVPTADVTVYGSMPFCEGGGTVTLATAGSSSYTYLWSTGETTQNIDVHHAGTYRVTVTNSLGCSTTSSDIVVTTKPLPSATVSGSATVCSGSSATISVSLTGTAPWNLTWSDGFVQSNVASSPATRSVTPNQTTTYSLLQVYDSTNCVGPSSGSATITVNAKPPKPSISGATTYCAGGNVTLSAPAGYSYSWSNGATTQNVTVQAGTYHVTVSNGSGCTATSDDVVVTAKPLPTATVSGSASVCAGSSATISATLTGTGPWNITWSDGFVQSNVGSSPATRSVNPASTTTYSVQQITDSTTCSGTASGSATITVNANPPVPVITPSGSTAICPGTTVTLTAPAGYSYLWSNGLTTRAITVGAGNYSVTVTNASNCSATSAATSVTLKTTTSITQPGNQTIARNTSTTLTVSASGTNLHYQWYSGTKGTTTTPMGTNASQTVGPFPKKGTNSFWVRVTGDCGVVDSNTITVTVN